MRDEDGDRGREIAMVMEMELETERAREREEGWKGGGGGGGGRRDGGTEGGSWRVVEAQCSVASPSTWGSVAPVCGGPGSGFRSLGQYVVVWV